MSVALLHLSTDDLIEGGVTSCVDRLPTAAEVEKVMFPATIGLGVGAPMGVPPMFLSASVTTVPLR